MANATFFFTPLVLLLIPEHCHDRFFLDFDFFHAPCLKIALSKGLGYGIVVGSAMIKIPQIIKVVQASSVEGLSLVAFVLEAVAMTVTVAYSVVKQFPFSAWGESFFMSIQTVVLIMLYLHYTGKPLLALVTPFICGGSIYVLMSGLTPLTVLTQLVALNIPFIAIGRLIQIVTNFRNGHTGQLSFIMVLLLFLGAIARIFTTLQETGDRVMLLTFLTSTLLNGILVAQVLFYWNVRADMKKKTN